MTDLLANNAARIALLFLLFVAVAAVTFGIAITIEERRDVRRRVAAGSTPSMDSEGIAPGAGLRVHDARGAWVALVSAIEKTGVPLVDTKDATLRSRLVAAGYTKEIAPRVYSLVGLITVIGFPIAAIGFLWASRSAPSLPKIYIAGMIAALLGLHLPSVWIRARADRRQQQIINGFPDALDLMLVCV